MSGSLCRGGDAHRVAVLMLLLAENALSYGSLISCIYMTAVGRAYVLPVSIVCYIQHQALLVGAF